MKTNSPIIIAAHAGTGKTTFAKEHPHIAVDLVCMPYKYILPNEFDESDSESCKANPDNELNPEYPQNYVDAIKSALNDGEKKFILIPPESRILKLLEKDGIPYVLCYPCRERKDEFDLIYSVRGNTDEFMEIFIGGWDNFIDNFESNTYGRHIVLQPYEYLTGIWNVSRFEVGNDMRQMSFEEIKNAVERVRLDIDSVVIGVTNDNFSVFRKDSGYYCSGSCSKEFKLAITRFHNGERPLKDPQNKVDMTEQVWSDFIKTLFDDVGGAFMETEILPSYAYRLRRVKMGLTVTLKDGRMFKCGGRNEYPEQWKEVEALFKHMYKSYKDYK
jgi:hypothetical protein